MSSVAESILSQALARPAINGIHLIGVDGCSGSGKSTLARSLVSLSGGSLIEIDDFVSWNDFSGWWPRFESQVLAPLLAGRDAIFQARDWANDWLGDSLGPWKTAPRRPVVIIEGVTCTRRSSVVSYAVWTSAPASVRLARGLARDHAHDPSLVESLWTRWMAWEDEFFALDDTQARADYVLDT